MKSFVPLCLLAIVLPFGGIVPVAAQPATPTVSADPPPALTHEATARQLIAELSERRFHLVVKQFDDPLREALPPDKLETVWTTLEQHFGAFAKAGPSRIRMVGDVPTVYVACEFANQPIDAKIVFDAQGRVGGLWFLPAGTEAPAPPETILEREVAIGSDPWILPGTLSLPTTGSLWPAIVLVHGSGPLDRDETLGAAKPFRDLAWGLAARGVAVLRYDKRTYAYKDRKDALRSEITIRDEVIDDAVAALKFLRSTEGIDPARVFIVGHSMGGMMAPRIAQADDRAAGLVLLAPAARSPHLAIVPQSEYILGLDGEVSAHERSQLDHMQLQVDAVERLMLSGESEGDTPLLGAPPAYWLSLRGYDPPAAAAALGMPILLIQGERDYQISEADLRLWLDALGNLPAAVIQIYPQLNHLLIPGEGPSSPAEYRQPGRVAPEVIAAIADWIDRQRPPLE
jgi:hypothetical protein